MLTLIILFLGYSGTFAFALSGIRLFDWNKPKAKWKASITAFLSSFGGGLTRDLLLLHCRPAILNAQIDLCILVISCLCYAFLHAAHKASILNHAFVKKTITLLDGAGTAVFVCMGVDTAIRCGAPWIVALLCGIITAIGGGIWAAIISGKCLHVVLRSAPCYRTIVAIHATIYSILKYSTLQIEDSVAMVLIISCTICCYIQEHLITSENTDGQSAKAPRIKRKDFYLVPTCAQLFRSILNPTRGRKVNRIVLINGGRHHLIQSIMI